MATKKHGADANGSANSTKAKPRSAAYFDRGITDDITFANMTLALMGDLIDGRISPAVGNSVCANGRNIIKIVELKHKFGQPTAAGSKTLALGNAR